MTKPIDLPAHVERLDNELTDLSTKINELDKLAQTEAFNALPEGEKELLFIQHCAMVSYHFALRCRLHDELNKLQPAQA